MPGPFSIFRKEVFDIVGEYHGAHNAEDLEMTLRLHKHHMKIANAHKAYVYTVGPSTFKSLLRQRVRWIRGFLENAWDYRDMFFKKEYGHFGMFTLPVASTFIFYVLYAMSFTLFNTVRLWSIRIEEYLYTGIHVPTFNFDPFYLSTDILMVQSIFLLTMLGIILTISRGIANDKSNLFMNLIFYILLYPIIGSAFVFISVYKFLFNKENKWHIQDNKIQPNITN
jgi:cellulose synthase/poly-beta-1,6-N-acetylglucosamine synthase-like glycosyltransferase